MVDVLNALRLGLPCLARESRFGLGYYSPGLGGFLYMNMTEHL